MRYLSAKDLLDLVSPSKLIAAIEQALCDFAEHEVIVPPRAHLKVGENTLLVMPVVGKDAFGTKVVCVAPSNAGRDLPVTSGVMVLNDPGTGLPLAILDAAALTAQRTGAVGALGLKCTTPPDIDSVGIVGVGVQGTWQAIFACAVRSIRTIYFHARSDDKAGVFVAEISKRVPETRLVRCRSIEEMLSYTEVLIAATTSNVPLLREDYSLLRNKHFISVGSFKPTMQELPNAVYELAASVIVDSDAAKDEVGDLINPISSGVLREERIIHLAHLIVGKLTFDRARTTVFKSVGSSLYDFYAACAFLTEAERMGRGTWLE